MMTHENPGSQTFFHGTKADLALGELIAPGHRSNYGAGKTASYVYFTETLDAAAWGAELASGDGIERIYLVEPTGPMEDDPNLTDKRYPGNPTKSYRSRHPLRIAGEVGSWQGHTAEQLAAMRESLLRLEKLCIEAIQD